MSAFAGAWPDHGVVSRFAPTLAAEGPDARTELLAHDLRVSIAELQVDVDTNAGRSAEGAWAAVVIGHVTALRPLAVEMGRPELAASPGAVLAELAARTGPDRAVSRLRGDLAAVLWSAEGVWLWRAPSGGRRVLVSRTEEGWAFATNAAALARHPSVPAPDAAAAARFIATGVWAPGVVRPLAPGELLRVAAPLPPPPSDTRTHALGTAGAPDRWARSLEYAVELAVRQHATSEPAALAWSGGLYASSIATMLADYGDVRHLTLGDGDGAARGVAFGVSDAVSAADELAAALDAPHGSPEAVGRWLLARQAADGGARVLFTGDGGGSTFGLPAPPPGRLSVAADRVRALAPRPAAAALRGVARALTGPLADRAHERAATALRDARVDGVRALAEAVAITGAHGLQLRAPLAEPSLVELALGIPIGVLLPSGASLYARALADRLPEPPRRVGFPHAVERWLAAPGAWEGVPEALDGWCSAADVAQARSADPARAWRLRQLARWRVAHL